MDNEFIWSVVAIEIDKLLKGIQIQGVGQENIIRRGSRYVQRMSIADNPSDAENVLMIVIFPFPCRTT